MKKKIAILLSIITLIICGWVFISNMVHLDIPSNKNDQSAAFEKKRIALEIGLSDPEKEVLYAKIDSKREKEREVSNNAFKTQFTISVIFVIQLTLLIILFLIPVKIEDKK